MNLVGGIFFFYIMTAISVAFYIVVPVMLVLIWRKVRHLPS